jgi:hypothetical protein
MARPSKLTDKQWAEIERRLLDGDKPAALAKEYGIDRAAITRKFSQQVRNVNLVANQIVAVEKSLRALPVAQQLQAITLADELRAISTHLAGAAKFGAMTAHKLSAIANEQSEFIDSAATGEENAEALKSVMALTKTANEAAATGLNLLSANKEMTKAAHAADEPQAMTLEEFYGGKA